MKLLNLFKSSSKSEKQWFLEAQDVAKKYKTDSLKSITDSMIKYKNGEISWDRFEQIKNQWQIKINNETGPLIVKCLNNALEINPGFCEALLAKGEFIAKKYFLPYEWNESVAIENRSDGAHYEFLNESVNYFKHALESNSKYPDTHYFLGIHNEKNNDLDNAINEYDNAIAIEAHYAGALFGKIRILALKGDTDKALALYKQAETLIPSIIENMEYSTERWLKYNVG